jgi:hypothetical protein
MTGNSILKDGRSVVEVYGIDLDKLKEGERIGVMKTSEVTGSWYSSAVFGFCCWAVTVVVLRYVCYSTYIFTKPVHGAVTPLKQSGCYMQHLF